LRYGKIQSDSAKNEFLQRAAAFKI
jgi:hypothetical protein